MTLYTQQNKNITKTWLLISVFLVLVVALGYALSYWLNSAIPLWIAVIYSIISSFISYWYSDQIILTISRAKPASRKEYFDLYNIVENLSITAGLPMPKIYVMNEKSPNAFATGRDPKHAVVCVTSGLLDILDKTELEGVIAHELSHIGNRDILLSSVIVVLANIIALMSRWFSQSMFWGNGRDNNDNNGLGLLGLIFTLLAIIFIPIASMLTQLAISRKREFLADASGVLLTRYPEGLISALEKIDNSNIPLRYVSNTTRSLFIADPYKKKSMSWFQKIWLTHPPVEDRIKALKSLNI